MDPHEYLRNDVRRIYALSGLIDEDEFNSIDTMNIRTMYKKALLWNNMSGNLLTATYRLKCKCGKTISSPYIELKGEHEFGYFYYPEFMATKLTMEQNRVNNLICSCGMKNQCKYYTLSPQCETYAIYGYSYRYSERLTRAQKVLKTLKELTKLEESQTTPEMAQKLDKLEEELLKKEIENRKLLKINDANRGKLD